MTTMTIAGLRAAPSERSPKETMDRLEQAIRAKGMTIFGRVDHAAGAHEAGWALRPTEVLLFGDARVGTRLMLLAQTMGIDLPLKALVWQDEAGQTWIAYDDPGALAERHGVAVAGAPVTTKMTALLEELVAQATGRA